jgi:ABC-type phosphate/phosphonate transport system substrate-binding protein
MFAALPMYERPQSREAHDRFWTLVRDSLRESGLPAPDTLDRTVHHMDGWARPDLVLGQICNLPYRARFQDRVTLIGASDTGLPDAIPGYYYSVFVVRADDPATDPADYRNGRFAYNEGLSNSGWDAPQTWAARNGFAFPASLRTGTHFESLRAVAENRADIAAIDAVTFRNFMRWEPIARRVRVIGHTAATPGMTFVTALGHDPSPYRAAISAAISALSASDRDTISLYGIVPLPASAYDIPLPAPPMPDLSAESA